MKFRRVVLIGMSGAGKSTVGRALASRLEWQLIDLDAEIERREGRTIPDIFASSGETAFRAIEREVFSEALAQDGAVIATGGGAVANDEVWTPALLEAQDTLSVLLEASPESLHRRLVEQQAQDPSGAIRPMLAGADPLARIAALKREREPWYRKASVVLPVERWPVDRVVGWLGRILDQDGAAVELDLSQTRSRIQVADGAAQRLGHRIREQWPRTTRVWVVADEGVAQYHLNPIAAAAAEAGIDVRCVTFPSGESSKSVSGLAAIQDALLDGGIERTDLLVALGGGVAGDLVGFAAATTLRGVGLVQVPTSLLAMVDSSVGGKTGINHRAGKNLIGAFYQPPIVLIDPLLLATLPDREYRSGWAEIIKHGVIEPSTPAGESGLRDLIEANATGLAERSSAALNAIIARNVEIKASVVRADEREAGLRAILNFGHTIGHAVEAAGYSLLHGEAVAVGMHGAMQLGHLLGRIGDDEVSRVVELLTSFGLQATSEADAAAIRQLMRSDKKRVAGEQQWVLPVVGGRGVEVVRGVPQDVVDQAIARVVRA